MTPEPKWIFSNSDGAGSSCDSLLFKTSCPVSAPASAACSHQATAQIINLDSDDTDPGHSPRSCERVYITLNSDSDSDSDSGSGSRSDSGSRDSDPDGLPSLQGLCISQPQQSKKKETQMEEKSGAEVCLPAGSFDVVLVIDQREVHAHKDTTAILVSRLAAKGIPFTFRTLPIGDFMWVCQSNKKSATPALEVALDYIIERKREDDLISSIIDGRFEEQKFRLTRSGFRNITYVIEKYSAAGAALCFRRGGWMRRGTGRGRGQGRDQEAVVGREEGFAGTAGGPQPNASFAYRMEQFGKGKFMAALMHTQVHNRFFLKQTESFDETLSYLICMTRALSSKYSERDIRILPEALADRVLTYGTLVDVASLLASPSTPKSAGGCSENRLAQQRGCDAFISPIYHIKFEDFSRLHGKHALMTHQDLYLKQLTCIRLMSPERALAISRIHPTMLSLFEAYEQLETLNERKHLLQDIIYELPNKRIGKKLSERVYETVFGTLS